MNAINLEALARVQAMPITSGSHSSIDDGMCVMEACAYVAGEPWSDEPACACPVIGAFLRSWNDALSSDEVRTRLLSPLITVLVGTRSTPAIEQRRATMAADWLIRVHTPAWLRLAKLETHAAAMESLPEITDFAQCPLLVPTLNAVRNDANADWDAVGDAAGVAAWAASWDAAGVATRNAAWDAAGDAARNAAWAAARNAAGVAARNAARNALQPTVERLQISAVELVKRMVAAQVTT